ncbi:hypothetical protein [Desulfonatronum lacustre]|uniref:hypothetical protein n=1 Tax=Desulfonatronum lacustre TaxID=66849 RepID=UPI00048F28CA|nr:hypothetical protein [Desulfonatronum lacustre]
MVLVLGMGCGSEEQPARYADFLAKVIRQILREEADPDRQREICKTILAHLGVLPSLCTCLRN